MEVRTKRIIKKEEDIKTKEVIVLNEVPESMKKLVRYVMRGFYEADAWIVMEYLIIFPCIKEEDLAAKLKIDSKQLRKLLSELSRDRLIQSRTRMELPSSANNNSEAVGRHQRQTYFYINYESFINVVKFRLDHVRAQIEQAARDCVTKPSFVCTICEHPFTDLEVDRLFDPVTLALSCTFCGGDVTEQSNVSSDGGIDSRALIIRFNEQLADIFSLLREVENVRLAPEILQPPFLETADIFKSFEDEDKDEKANGSVLTNGTGNDIETIEVRVTDEPSSFDSINEDNLKSVKALPEWIATSTVDGRLIHGETKNDDVIACPPSPKNDRAMGIALEILLNYESRSKRKGKDSNTHFSSTVGDDLGFSFCSSEVLLDQKNRSSNIEVKSLKQSQESLNGVRTPVFQFRKNLIPLDFIDKKMYSSMNSHETKLFRKMSLDYAKKLLFL